MSTRKNHADRILDQKWILGEIYPDTNERLVIRDPDKSSQILLPIIQDYIAPSAHIKRDSWKVYNSIIQLPQNYIHTTVNHSSDFEAPVTKTHA